MCHLPVPATGTQVPVPSATVGLGTGACAQGLFWGSRYPHPLQVLPCRWPCLSARPGKRPDILVNKLDLSQLVTRLSCSGSAGPNLHLSPYCTRVQKGDIYKNSLQQEAREDGIINFEKTKRNKSLHKIYGNFAGCPAELQQPQRPYFRHVLHSLGQIFAKFSSMIPVNFGHFKS